MADPIDSKSLQLLIDLLKSEVTCLRGAGAFGLSLLGPDAKPALQALSEALGHEKDAEVARAIVFALEDIGLEAAPGLALGLKHPIAQIRDASSEALSNLALVYREGGEEGKEGAALTAICRREAGKKPDLIPPAHFTKLCEHLVSVAGRNEFFIIEPHRGELLSKCSRQRSRRGW